MATKAAKKGKLTPKMERFCQEYLVDMNMTAAAIRAGYKANAAHTVGWENIRKPAIALRINELRKDTAERLNVTKEGIIRMLREVAEARLEDILDPETGAVLPVHEWPQHMKRTANSIEVDEMYAGRGDDRVPIGIVRKVKLSERVKAAEVLNKMLGFNAPDKVAQTTPDGEGVGAPIINIYTVPPKANDDD